MHEECWTIGHQEIGIMVAFKMLERGILLVLWKWDIGILILWNWDIGILILWNWYICDTRIPLTGPYNFFLLVSIACMIVWSQPLSFGLSRFLLQITLAALSKWVGWMKQTSMWRTRQVFYSHLHLIACKLQQSINPSLVFPRRKRLYSIQLILSC